MKMDSLPRWNDRTLKAGTMIRAALWLVTEIGQGNAFTKEQLRSAFEGVSQIDRRLRDLRKYGWVIHTSIQDLSLNPEEQRFVSMGTPVWQKGGGSVPEYCAVSAKKRRSVFAENDYQCVHCGIAGGERYPDAPHMSAVLIAAKKTVAASGAKQSILFYTECSRCHAGESSSPVNLADLIAEIAHLDPADKKLLLRWAEQGRRNTLERAWQQFRRLPNEAKEIIRKHIESNCPPS